MLMTMKARSKTQFVVALGKRVAAVRKNKGLTQEKLASLADLDRMTIALVETGHKKPSVVTIYKLAKALKVEPATFFEGL
jgi:transcriptional regulator with XRE-family HTH domain